MCPEFFLALLYLSILILINFFLFQFLKISYQTIQLLQKFINIYSFYPKDKLNRISFLSRSFQKKKELGLTMFEWNNINDDTEDIILTGNLIKFFQKSPLFSAQENYFFILLEKQYLSE